MRARQRSLHRLVASGGVVAAVVALVLATSPALAQAPLPTTNEGPQFGAWGPGREAPTVEGPVGMAAPPPVRPGLPPPPTPRVWGGCNWDLRGNWNVSGRQDQPSYRPYATSLNVAQYGHWLRIDQPDAGYTYYGQCNGNQISLDVYQGPQFVGYEAGTVDWGGGYFERWGGARVRANWQSFVPGPAGGSETWHR